MLIRPTSCTMALPDASGNSAVISTVGWDVGPMVALKACAIDVAIAQLNADNKDNEQRYGQRYHELICGHDHKVVADNGPFKAGVPATRRPIRPAISAYIPTHAIPAILSSHTKEDLKWRTTISQNRHRIGRTVSRMTQGPAQAGLALSSLASSLCWSCSMPSLAGQALPRYKTQAALNLPRSCQHQPNNTHHSRTDARGRGITPARAFLRPDPIFARHFKRGGHAFTAEARPC